MLGTLPSVGDRAMNKIDRNPAPRVFTLRLGTSNPT